MEKKRNKNLVFRTPVILESTEGERNYDSFRVESSVILNRDATSVWYLDSPHISSKVSGQMFYKFDALNFT